VTVGDHDDIDVLQARFEALEVNLNRKEDPKTKQHKARQPKMAWTAKNKAKAASFQKHRKDEERVSEIDSRRRDKKEGCFSAVQEQPSVWPRRVRFDV
jgi:hypothetical protein